MKKHVVVLSRQAEHIYCKLEKKIKLNIRQSLLSLEDDPFAGKRLHGDLKENFSLRVGKLRIIYEVAEKENKVYIVAIAPRKNVYQ